MRVNRALVVIAVALTAGNAGGDESAAVEDLRIAALNHRDLRDRISTWVGTAAVHSISRISRPPPFSGDPYGEKWNELFREPSVNVYMDVTAVAEFRVDRALDAIYSRFKYVGPASYFRRSDPPLLVISRDPDRAKISILSPEAFVFTYEGERHSR